MMELCGSEFMTLPRSRIRHDADGRVMRMPGDVEPMREYVEPLDAVRRLLADARITGALQQLTAGVESASIVLAVFSVSDDRERDARELREYVERVWWGRARPMITGFAVERLPSGDLLEGRHVSPFLRPDERPLRLNVEARDDDFISVNGLPVWPR